jgi:hypothetical protein
MSNPEHEALNNEHALNPQPGDYWVEMFCGICIVLSVSPLAVLLCRTKKDVDRYFWAWDLDKTEIMSREEFNRWLRYKSFSMQHKTWCDCVPQAQHARYPRSVDLV